MKTLQKRLAGLYTITTGSILLLVMGAFLLSSIQSNRNAQLEQFQVIWNSLTSRFLTSSIFSHGFLAQTEADYQMVVHIRENGTPLLYQGAWQPLTDRRTLIKLAADQAAAQGVFIDQAPISSTAVSSSLMTIEGEHKDSYYAIVLVLAVKNGVKSICAVSYIPPARESMGGTVLYLCVLAVFGITCLGLISWKFVGWSLKPVEESRQKQARFLAAASHELRSPLAVLRSGIAALASSPKAKDTLLPVIDSECVRMSRLIDDIQALFGENLFRPGLWVQHAYTEDIRTGKRGMGDSGCKPSERWRLCRNLRFYRLLWGGCPDKGKRQILYCHAGKASAK